MFLSNLSHELRTPLNSIIGFSELLKRKVSGELNEKQKRYVDNILTSSNFLLNLINDILDLSKVEAGKIELVFEKIPVPEAINESIILIEEKAAKHNIIIKKEFDSELDFIEADRQRFMQILFNLLSNAVKFSKPEGGVVTIATKKSEDTAEISVSDTGIGIKPKNMGKLFQKFEQLDPGITRKYGGTGLGLVITKQLVELHGGRIWAKSRYGEGSTFTFSLPLKVKRETTGYL
ncbi:MAG: HAMP domain-containing sensor histidine kinase [Candidatus Methanoperedens sp.]|nr:HAMP domain-containing sensor histidine kinase [Candidatus Methanoperedens sp.]